MNGYCADWNHSPHQGSLKFLPNETEWVVSTQKPETNTGGNNQVQTTFHYFVEQKFPWDDEIIVQKRKLSKTSQVLNR